MTGDSRFVCAGTYRQPLPTAAYFVPGCLTILRLSLRHKEARRIPWPY